MRTYICGLHPRGIAHTSGKLQAGDQLLKVTTTTMMMTMLSMMVTMMMTMMMASKMITRVPVQVGEEVVWDRCHLNVTTIIKNHSAMEKLRSSLSSSSLSSSLSSSSSL